MFLPLLRSHGLDWLLSPLDEEADLHVMGQANVAYLSRSVSQLPAKSPRAEAERDALSLGLEQLARQAVAPLERPLLPAWRTPDHFEMEEEVVVVTSKGMFSRDSVKLVPQRLLLGYVVDDVRAGDGSVTVVTRQRTHSHAFGEGRAYRSGVCNGTFVRRTDLASLQQAFRSKSREDQRFAQLWLRHASSRPMPGYATSLRSLDVHGTS